jgi:hypothetical protein
VKAVLAAFEAFAAEAPMCRGKRKSMKIGKELVAS